MIPIHHKSANQKRMLLNVNATDMFDALVVMSQRNQTADKGEKDVQDCIY